jgi:general secretion pathway protein G
MNDFFSSGCGLSRMSDRRSPSWTRHGFTLLELLVVILIIGLLTGIVAPRFMSQISRSEVTTARAQMDAFRKAIEAFRIDNGRYPTTAEGLDALVVAPSGAARWNGPYLQGAIPADPWGTKYQYQAPGPSGRDYQILSYGRDRAPGGTGDDADIAL